MRVYRRFGGAAKQFGLSSTSVDPRTMPNVRDALGLPDSNSGAWMAIGDPVDATGVRERRALPLDGQAGGAPELLIPSPATQIVLLKIVPMERVDG